MRWFTQRPLSVAQKSVKPLHVQSRSQTPQAPPVVAPDDDPDDDPDDEEVDPPEDEEDEEDDEEEEPPEDEDEDDVDVDVEPASFFGGVAGGASSKPEPSGIAREGESSVVVSRGGGRSSALPAAHATSATLAPTIIHLRTSRTTRAGRRSSFAQRMQVRSSPVVAIRKSGAGQDALHVLPLQSGAILRGRSYAQPPGPQAQEIPVFGSEPRVVGAATTQTPVRFTWPFGQCDATAQAPSLRGLPSGQTGVHVPRMLSGMSGGSHVNAPRTRRCFAVSRRTGSASMTSASLRCFSSVVSWIHA